MTRGFNRFWMGLATSVSVCVLSGAASAQDDPSADEVTARDTITVLGTRLPTPLDQVGRSVTVVTAEDIALRQQRFVYDALQSVPGVQLTRSGSFGALANISLRGLPSDQTLVVQDGVVLNDPASFGNGFNFANFDTGDIERIEVLRGAQSTLYGSNAVGGVVNIITRDGREGFGGVATLEGGSFDTLRGAASLFGGTDRMSGRVTLSGTRSNGFSSAEVTQGNADDDGYENVTVSARGGYRPSDTLTFDTVIRYSDSANDFDDGAANDGDRRGESDELTVASKVTHLAFDGRWENRLLLTYARTDREDRNMGAVTFDALGTRLSLDYQGTVRPLSWLSAVYGAEAETQESEVAVGFGGNQEIETYSGFGLVQLTPLPGLSLNGGVRHDANSDFDNATTFSVSGAYRVPVLGALLRASFAEGFRAPSVGELSFNPDLEPEDSEGWDIGLARDFFNGRLSAEVTYFNQSITNQIGFDLSAFTFVNIDEFDTEGVELFVQGQLTQALDLAVTYTYTDAFTVSGSIAALNQPDHRVVVDAVWQPITDLTLGASVTYNGEEPESGGRVLDAYTLVNLRGSYAVNEGLDLFVRVENLTDADYQDNVGFSTAPLSAFGGVTARF